MNEETKELIKKIINDRATRISIARESHWWFFHLYFPHYATRSMAPFQKEMLYLTAQENIRTVCIVAFRGSGKSTLITMSYPIWAILGMQARKFVLIISQTRSQAKQHMANLRNELESNQVLWKDLGPFQEEKDEWGTNSLVFSQFNARISIASTEQSIRGLRHYQYRPDLIICDDIEDLNSVKTQEGRDKTFNWLTGEVIPAGDNRTRLFIVGNLLHEDSCLMRLKEKIEEKSIDGVFKEYPLINDEGHILWPGKFPNKESVEEERRRIGNEGAWHREYLLRIISNHERVVHPEWIHYYDNLPRKSRSRYIKIGMDLAISKSSTADYTAMVAGKVYDTKDETFKVYILPNPINSRLDFPETVALCKDILNTFSEEDPELLIEDVGYQGSLIQHLEELGFRAQGIKPRGQDKRARLALTTHLIQNGTILFPRKGVDTLIKQLIGFGVEKHDDLADAFAFLILGIIEEEQNRGSITFFREDGEIIEIRC